MVTRQYQLTHQKEGNTENIFTCHWRFGNLSSRGLLHHRSWKHGEYFHVTYTPLLILEVHLKQMVHPDPWVGITCPDYRQKISPIAMDQETDRSGKNKELDSAKLLQLVPTYTTCRVTNGKKVVWRVTTGKGRVILAMMPTLPFPGKNQSQKNCTYLKNLLYENEESLINHVASPPMDPIMWSIPWPGCWDS